MKSFKQLGLGKEFIENLNKLGIVEPTEIQEKAIPSVLKGNDIVATAFTGSGKTLAFASGIVEKMESTGKSRFLVLTPTRELAEQVASDFRKFAFKKFKVFSLYGGVKLEDHLKKVKGSDIIVATPGRLLDVIDRQALSLKNIEILILDEFDRMLDMGFQREVDLIIRKCPEKRQTMLFSATKIGDIDLIIDAYTKKAKEITVKQHIDSAKLSQVFYDTLQKEKFSLFYHLIKKEESGKSMVFCSTRINTEFIAKSLENLGIETKVIHGGLDQKQRTRALKNFHKEGGVLICTDIAARGLDIKGITHIYNYDLPSKPEDYIHRIGRTARAGKGGKAITILSPRDHNMFENILKLPNVEIQKRELPVFEKVDRETLPKLKKQTREKTHTKKKGIEWESIEDSSLSNRFRKRTVERKTEKEDSAPKGVSLNVDFQGKDKPRKKTRRAGKKRKGEKTYGKKKKISIHRSAKGKKVTRGRAGNRGGKRKISKKPKGRSNRRSKR